jgi:hypothetical protein
MRGSQPLRELESIEAKPAESSTAPSGFGNASPFVKDRHRAVAYSWRY